LVADDDGVGVRDAPGIAHEPLVGLDGDRAVGGVVAVEQRGADAIAIAAVAQLAVELVDEVAAVGEDQDAAGARRLHEAQRGDGLARSSGVLEPEALGGVGVLGLLLVGPVLLIGLVLPVLRLFILGLVLGLLVLVVEITEVVAVLVVLVLVLVDRIELGGGGRRHDVLGDDAVGRGSVGGLTLGQQRGERARQRVDLVGREHGAVD